MSHHHMHNKLRLNLSFPVKCRKRSLGPFAPPTLYLQGLSFSLKPHSFVSVSPDGCSPTAEAKGESLSLRGELTGLTCGTWLPDGYSQIFILYVFGP